MRIVILCLTSFALVANAAPAPADAQKPQNTTCDAKYYNDLVGRNVNEARNISGTTNYRVLAQGVAPGVVQPKRMTLTINNRNQIIDVACG